MALREDRAELFQLVVWMVRIQKRNSHWAS
jgi:hypothetical protein